MPKKRSAPTENPETESPAPESPAPTESPAPESLTPMQTDAPGSPAPVQADVPKPRADVVRAWSRKSRLGYLENIVVQRHSQLIAINQEPIPCKLEHCRDSGKPTPIRLTIIRPANAGFAKFPFTPNQAVTAELKAAAEIIKDPKPEGDLHKLRVYSSETLKGVGFRGERTDSIFADIEMGDTVTCFVSQQDFQPKMMQPMSAGKNSRKEPKATESKFPEDVDWIPPMSVLNISLSTKNRDQAEGGSMLRVNVVRFANISLNTLQPFFKYFPASSEEAVARIRNKRDVMPWIVKDIDERDDIFVATVARTAYLGDEHNYPNARSDTPNAPDTKLVMLNNWSEKNHLANRHIDIPLDAIMRCCNGVNEDWATTCVEIAANLGALDLIVFSSDYWARNPPASQFRGVPVIDTERFFAAIDLGNVSKCVDHGVEDSGVTWYRFATGALHYFEDGTSSPLFVRVWDGKSSKEETPDATLLPTTSDLSFVPERVSAQGLRFEFSIRDPDADYEPVLHGRFLTGPSAMRGGSKRRKFGAVFTTEAQA